LDIKEHVTKVINKVETNLKNHRQSGYHTSGNERRKEIRNSFLGPKGKNVDLSFMPFSCWRTKIYGLLGVVEKKNQSTQDKIAAEIMD
jgi:hypothetical protein